MLSMITIALLTGARLLDAQRMTMFISQQNGELMAVDIANDASAHDLYEAAHKSFGHSQQFVLAIGGKDIEDDDTPIADMSISAESTLTARWPLTDAQKLCLVFERVAGKESLSFWPDCVRCMDQPQLDSCSDISQWQGVHNGIIVHARHCELSGQIDLSYIPDSVVELQIDHNQFQSVDLSQLRGTSLKVLYLRDNNLTSIDLTQLKGSALQSLFIQADNPVEVQMDGISEMRIAEEIKLDQVVVGTMKFKMVYQIYALPG